MRRAVPAVALSALAVATTAGCDNGWWTYHRDPARSGVNAELAAAGRVGASWTTNLDGAVYAQPLVVGGTLIAATENDSLYGLDPGTGAVRWRTHVASPVSRSALPCGNIDPLGITGTPAYDPASKLVFAGRRGLGAQAFARAVDTRASPSSTDRQPRAARSINASE